MKQDGFPLVGSSPTTPRSGYANPRLNSILIVDDEPGIRDYLQRGLEKHFGLVELAEDVAAASIELLFEHLRDSAAEPRQVERLLQEVDRTLPDRAHGRGPRAGEIETEGAPGPGLWLSRDNGRHWQPFRDLPFSNIQRLTFDSRDEARMYVTTFGGSVWHGPVVPRDDRAVEPPGES